MKLTIKKPILIFVILWITIFAAYSAAAQDNFLKKVRNGVAVKGDDSGESANGYFIYARKGQTMTVKVLNAAKDSVGLTVARGKNFRTTNQVSFGREISPTQWRGKIPVSGTYYIHITAHDSGGYRLLVTLR